MKMFEIFYETVKPHIHSKTDVIVSVIHFMLVNEFDFTCLGIGETFTENVDEPGSELLPSNWNKEPNQYILRYRSVKSNEDLKMILKCIFAGELFIPTLLPLNSSNEVHSVSIKPNNYVTDIWNKSVSNAFVSGSVDKLEEMLRKDFFNKLRPEVVRMSEKHDQPTNTQPSPLIETIKYPPNFARPHHDSYYDPHNPRFGLPRIGGSDLDPFSGGHGGGMFFNPFSNPRDIGPIQPYLPRGAVPPGARFDPFGPPGTGARFARPDPDHLPPPKKDDHMFM